jgi:hypothetical protein
LRGRTRCGVAFLCGGLCPAGRSADCRNSLAELENLDFSAENLLADPAALDRVAAEAARRCCGREVPALGLSLLAPGLPWRTGGVLGSPRRAARSAENLLEDLGAGLWLYAAPGGPGLVCAGGREETLELMAELEAGLFTAAHSLAGMRALYAYLLERGPDSFLGLSDGSGPGAEGVLFGRAGSQRFFATL